MLLYEGGRGPWARSVELREGALVSRSLASEKTQAGVESLQRFTLHAVLATEYLRVRSDIINWACLESRDDM